jgi:hypothetical protein
MVSGFKEDREPERKGPARRYGCAKKIRSANHPDRNPDSDGDLYQVVVEKLDKMRTATQ